MQARYGVTPVRHMANLDLLHPGLLACHGVMLTEDDMDLLQAQDVKIAHNAESNMKLASGIAPVPRLLERASASPWAPTVAPATTTWT